MKIDEKKFTALLKERAGRDWKRCLLIFRKYGPNLSFDVTNVLIHAVDRDRTKEVLSVLEEHFETHLKYQHPEIRGQVANRLLGVNPTQVMFLRICTDTLKLQPTNK